MENITPDKDVSITKKEKNKNKIKIEEFNLTKPNVKKIPEAILIKKGII